MVQFLALWFYVLRLFLFYGTLPELGRVFVSFLKESSLLQLYLFNFLVRKLLNNEKNTKENFHKNNLNESTAIVHPVDKYAKATIENEKFETKKESFNNNDLQIERLTDIVSFIKK